MVLVERRTSNAGLVLVFVSLFATILVGERFWQLNHQLNQMTIQLKKSFEKQKYLIKELNKFKTKPKKIPTDMEPKPCDAIIEKEAQSLIFYNVDAPLDSEIVEHAGPEKIEDPSVITIGNDEINEDAPPIIGQLDMVEDGYVIGWACEKGQKSKKHRVIFFIEDVQVGEVETDKPAPHSLVNRICSGASLEWSQNVVFNFKLPHLKEGIYKIRGFVYSSDGKWKKELNSSPMKFVQVLTKPGLSDAVKRKDDIIRARNAQVASLYERLHTRGAWESATKYDKIVKLNGTKTYENDYIAFIGINSGPTDIHHRHLLRQTWFPVGKELKEWEEKKKVIPRFVIGKSDWMPQKEIDMIRDEIEKYGDIMTVDIRGFEDASKRVLSMIKTVAMTYKTDFIFKAEKDVLIDVDALISYLTPLKTKGNLYMGCMKSGEIVTSGRKKWFEPEHWKFGDGVGKEHQKTYHRHAESQMFGISQLIGIYLAQNSEVLHGYAHDDVTLGAWLLGLEVEYLEHNKFCCEYSSCVSKKVQEEKCLSFYDKGCPGVCAPDTRLKEYYKSCIVNKKHERRR